MNGIDFIWKTAEDLILNPKDHPDAKIGDVVEIYLPEDDGVRLLLQITSFQEDKKGTKGNLIYSAHQCIHQIQEKKFVVLFN